MIFQYSSLVSSKEIFSPWKGARPNYVSKSEFFEIQRFPCLKSENSKIAEIGFIIQIWSPHVKFRHREIIWSQVVLENVLLTFSPPPRVEEGRVSQNLVLERFRALKSICTRNSVTQSSIESPGSCLVSERVKSLFYIYISNEKKIVFMIYNWWAESLTSLS